MAKRCGYGRIDAMRTILLAVCGLTLLAATGCFFPGERYQDDHRNDRSQYQNRNDHPGVDHSEHPGDEDHTENH